MQDFHLEILFGNFGLPFKESHFPEKISVRGVKIKLHMVCEHFDIDVKEITVQHKAPYVRISPCLRNC